MGEEKGKSKGNGNYPMKTSKLGIIGLEERPACLAPWLENPYRLASQWEVLRFFAADSIAILDRLASLKDQLRNDPTLILHGRQKLQPFFDTVQILQQSAGSMGMGCSAAQARRLLAMWSAPVLSVTPHDLISNIEDLELRVRDEFQERLFFYVEPDKSWWIERDAPSDPAAGQIVRMRLKTATECFGENVASRFSPVESDLTESIRCYVYGCNAACVFHLMRATEIAVTKLAKLCDMNDPKPSWGVVLDRAERFTQRTKFEDVPPTIQPHLEFLRTLVADMRSIQKVWRNKVVHVEDRIIPSIPEFSPESVLEIFSSTKAFLRHLAEGLPVWC
jgi:hypothetical protein